MTRPSIVRADTIDLQDHHAPSAQDHSKSPRLAGAANSLGPHQAETIREVTHDTADEQRRSPRVSLDNRNSLDEIDSFADELVANPSGANSRAQGTRDNNDSTMNQEDALAASQNGGISSSDEGELDGDDDLDDDMMDKISSSPSIEDGGCYPVTAPMAWPRRVSSLPTSQRSSSPSISGSSVTRVCSPYPEPLKFTPSPSAIAQLPRALPATIRNHRLQGEYADNDNNEAVHDADESWATFNSTEEFHEAYEEETQIKEADASHQEQAHANVGGKNTLADNRDQDIFYDCDAMMDLSDLTDDDSPDYDPLLTVPYEESFEDDDSTLSLPDDPNFTDSGWAIECLQELEDIDFEFVYALHTFVATVEGQANATKGDTMVLLDDSNSYWWLVRVVKDSSIGYLPAEHIETPTERLARLNKHRNVDLSATMLGDTAEKKAQTFKSPIRFGRKTVTFTSPTYHDYTEVDDYSSDEEDLDDLFANSTTAAKQDQQERKKDTREAAATISIIEDDSSEESARVEPLKPRSTKEVKMSMEPSKVETVEEEDESRDSEELLFDNKAEGPSRSRNGTVRNTDSFFRDETVETKKITLTPNLLRDDNQPRPSQDSTKDVKSRGSMDKLDKELMSDKEKKKHQDKVRKEKEKKPSAIRSFFSRKDRKKSVDDDDESFGKRSMDIVSEPRDSESIEEIASPQRSASKLQKPMARTETSPGKGGQGETSSAMELAAYFAESRVNDVSNVPPASMRIVNPETQETHEVPSNSQSGGDPNRARASSATAQHDDTKALARALGRSSSTGDEPRTAKSAKPRQLMDLDELSSSDEDTTSQPASRAIPEQTSEKKTEGGLRPQLPGAFPDSFDASGKPNGSTVVGREQRDRLSESPVQVSPVNTTRPPALEIDTSSQEGRSSSEVPSPELMPGDETPKDSSSTRSAKEPGWDDEKLRAFFDDGEHVRDLLMVVYDKTDVEPVGKDHPVVSGMFREQNAKLAEITTQLDNMLGDWLARKQRLRGTL
ncbi:Ff.00g106110.m01.CDS01 [Fusarium sp. VM40]|nr:Ff.00g106110.m01.CDS01 [Fusarium sp. VM40]